VNRAKPLGVSLPTRHVALAGWALQESGVSMSGLCDRGSPRSPRCDRLATRNADAVEQARRGEVSISPPPGTPVVIGEVPHSEDAQWYKSLWTPPSSASPSALPMPTSVRQTDSLWADSCRRFYRRLNTVQDLSRNSGPKASQICHSRDCMPTFSTAASWNVRA